MIPSVLRKDQRVSWKVTVCSPDRQGEQEGVATGAKQAGKRTYQAQESRSQSHLLSTLRAWGRLDLSTPRASEEPS